MSRPIPAPLVLAEVQPFWAAASAGQLLVKRCCSCAEVHHYPRDICPHCLSDNTEWLPSAGAGTLYSFSTMGQGEAAYTLALVTLDEGVTLLTNIVDCAPATLQIGQRMRVTFCQSEGGQAVPMFTPS